MSASETSVSGERRGYGRGLILGLTMAESMLLLVFCLLLAAGAMIVKEKKALEKALQAKAEIEKDAKILADQLDVAAQLASDDPALKKEWSKLILARDRIVQQGLTLELVAEKADIIKILVEKNLSEEETADAVTAAESLRENKLTAKEFRELVAVSKMLVETKVTPEMVAETQKSGLKPEDIAQVNALLKEIPLAPEELQEVSKLSHLLKEMDIAPEDLRKLTDAIDVLREEVVAASSAATPAEQLREIIGKAEAYDADAGNAAPHKWPPIINLSETRDYYFTSGSAELSPMFEKVLREGVAQQIAATAKGYNVDVIEVIGHTDEQPMGRRPSNLDLEFKNVLSGSDAASELQPADNAGLGLARAIAVADVLRKDPNLKGMSILPMSGAQLILPGDHLTDGAQSGDVSSRRRIEIRVRKRNEGAKPTNFEATTVATEASATGQMGDKDIRNTVGGETIIEGGSFNRTPKTLQPGLF